MTRHTTLGLAGLLAAVVLLAASCGDTGGESAGPGEGTDRKESREGGSTKNDGYSDERFIDRMVPHHRSAVEMAEAALKNAEHREIKELSKDIISTQEAEIGELKNIRREDFGTSKVSTEMDMGQMQDMGTMDAGNLVDQEPFDRAFIDAMIPHHESAVEMARVARERSGNPRIRELAKDIVGAQKREISQLHSWRNEWYPEG